MKTAYLYGELKEELYLEQPAGYVIEGEEHRVLRLKRSLYGLKQAARAWNDMAKQTLAKIGFYRGDSDPCLFTKDEEDGTTTYTLLYVDDLLVVGACEETTKRVSKN